jgi:hypothetical protein
MKPSVAAFWLLLASVSVVASCGGGSAKPAPGMGCALNSDCATGLTCTFGLCHSACVVNGDCPTGQLCVESNTGTDGGKLNVCQLPTELKCVYNSNCASPLVCARDEQCRNQCQANVDCVSPQVCTDSKVCALTSQLAPGTNDVPVVTTGQGGGAGSQTAGAGGGAGATATGTGGSAGASGGGAGKGGAGGKGGAAGASSGTGGSTCTGPQDQFSNVSQGDANPAFNSAVAVRNADTLFIFSGYRGAAPVDGGADGGAMAGFAIYVQTFDAVTGIKRGASKFLMSVPFGIGGLGVNDVAVAPTGEIALLYTVASMNNYADALYMTVFSTAPGDGGTTALTVEKTVQLESVFLGSPRVIWQPSTQQFVVSWKYQGSGGGWFARVRRYHSNGNAAGAAINAIPTYGGIYQPNQEDDAYVGASGSYLGLGYQSTNNNWAYLTIVDADGFQVGPIVSVSNGGVDNWVAAGGTSQGFVTMWTGNGHISGVFVPLTGTGSVLSDAGVPDGGQPPLKPFSFTSTAATGKLINDDYGGANGVGAVFLENDGASFVYVTTDGAKSFAEGTVLSSNGAIQADISNFGGSFVVSLFNGTTHAGAATVSSCP